MLYVVANGEGTSCPGSCSHSHTGGHRTGSSASQICRRRRQGTNLTLMCANNSTGVVGGRGLTAASHREGEVAVRRSDVNEEGNQNKNKNGDVTLSAPDLEMFLYLLFQIRSRGVCKR